MIGVAILVVAIVIIALSGVIVDTKDQNTSADYNNQMSDLKGLIGNTGGSTGGTVVNASCSSSRAKSFLATESAWPSGSTFCSSGSIIGTAPSFPSAGSSVSWVCKSDTGGANSPTCTATKSAVASFSSCLNILQTGNSSGDGVYLIDLDGAGGNSPFNVYCDMTSNGGGWTLMMKATQGTTFNYDSDYWTTNNTLNESETNLNDGDAKFRSFNELPITDIMARWPDIDSGNKYWVVNSFNSMDSTYLPNFFSTSNLVFLEDAQEFITNNGWSNVFSTQSDIRFYGFNFVNNIDYGIDADVRWGFGWNENGEGLYVNPATLSSGGAPGSDDVSGGIGMSSSFGNYSAGDTLNCCQTGEGMNRSARVEIYGR